jgi:hypothetical protein
LSIWRASLMLVTVSALMADPTWREMSAGLRENSGVPGRIDHRDGRVDEHPQELRRPSARHSSMVQRGSC